jgi:hypothetical protein
MFVFSSRIHAKRNNGGNLIPSPVFCVFENYLFLMRIYEEKILKRVYFKKYSNILLVKNIKNNTAV